MLQICVKSYFILMNKIVLVVLLVLAVNCARPPAPVCRTSPLPSIIPVSIGQTVRLDLQMLFDGYNLQFEGALKDHINVTEKYVANHSQFEQSMNFTSAKIKDHDRFLGLATHDHFTMLAIGYNHPESGVVIEKYIQIQDQPQLHCYDVEEVIDRNSSRPYAIIDCAVYKMGQVDKNQFLYVDLTTYKLILGSKISDVFVRFNHLIARRIQVIMDPFTRIQYLLRFYTAQGVDTAHSGQTYVEIFMITGSVMQLQIFDVIDHTLLGLHTLAIMDYQIHFNYIYILVKDSGLYQIQFTATQRLQRTGFFPIKMNINRFRVQQNGFNDDLHLIFSNDNTVYQYEWDVLNNPVLVTKYNLMAGSIVEELFMDQHFVIVLAWEYFNTQLQRRVWIFSRRTASYTNAFGSFKQPSYGPCIIIYRPFERTLHIIYEYRSYNLRINLPYLHVYPVSYQKAGDKQSYLVKATSSNPETGQKIQCRQTFNFIFIDNKDTTIFKTGLQGRNQTYVDAPDDADYNLQYQFFGRNLSYNVNFTLNTTEKDAKYPQAYVQKRVKASISFPQEIDQSKIVYFQMFLQNSREQVEDRNEIYGVVQVQQASSHPIYYLNCFVQTDAQFINPSLRCRIISKTVISLGRILQMSQIYDPRQRIVALVFEAKDTQVFVYYFYPTGFQYYGTVEFGYNYNNIMNSVEVTAKRQLVVTYQYGKRIQVYNLDDIHQSQVKPAQPILTINTRVMQFFRINYWAPVSTKVSIYHDEVTFVKTKNGVIAININQMGFPQVLFQIKTITPLYDFQVNRDTLVIITQKQMQMYRIQNPLRRGRQPFLLQKFESDFNLNEYDEINSDGLFYLVQRQDNMLLVVHPNMPSTSVIYTEFFIGNIKMIDSVRIKDKEVLFVYNGKQLLAYMFAQNPRLRVRWQPNQVNFTMNITAYNEKSTSEPYSTNFMIIQSNEAEIKFTQKFNETVIRKLGHVTTSKNSKKIDLNITLNDTQWFTGNVMHYFIKCKDCNKNNSNQFSITIQNHLKQLSTQIKVGEPVYDMHSTFTGIFGQMYNAIFKTFSHNDSVQYILNIPTTSRGEVCTKLAVSSAQDFVVSFCQLGGQVNIYITSLNTFKPFTMGPFPTDAEAVNHVQIVGNLIMIVDNDDDPFNRAGGVYLYYLNLGAEDHNDVLNMLDYLDYADLQIEGFRGTPFIASADLHKPLFNRDQYAIFLTEARTGNIFVFLFELSSNKQQAVYLHRRMFELNSLFPESAKHPSPLRVININILDYTVKFQARMRIEYVFILTVKNWHHVQLMMEFDEDYDLLAFQLVRLYERVSYPWELTNFIRLRKGSLNASYMAVNYRDYSRGAQVMVVYQLPYFRINSTQVKKQELEAGIPITRVLAAYRISDTAEVCFDFNTRDEHRLLFNDVSTNHLSQLELNKQLKIIIKNADPTIVQSQNITIIAENHYMNLTFFIQFMFNFPDDDDKATKIEIIWIIVLVIGFIVVVGLIFVWSRQAKTEVRDSVQPNNTQSLLTVDPEFKSNYINRSSADPESVRGTLNYTPPVVQNKNKMQRIQENPLEQSIQNKVENVENQKQEEIKVEKE